MKKQNDPCSGFFSLRLLTGLVLCLTGTLLGIAVLCAAPGQSMGVAGGSNTHTTRNKDSAQQAWQPERQMSREELKEAVATTPPTRNTFMATWKSVTGAVGYRLDVSTSSSFTSYLEGYENLDVGDTIGTTVTGLRPGTTYYYRARAYRAGETVSAESETTIVKTVAAAGLIIHPTFDSSITSNGNSAAIQGAISRAISAIESRYTDSITVQIRFRYSTVGPDGAPVSGNARSQYGISLFPWNTYLNALRADGKSANDSVGNANLPTAPPPGITNVVISTANGRALGFDTPPNTFANGTNGTGGPYDGIITLVSNNPFSFTRPPNGNTYDAQRSLEHEIDEVLGLGTFHDCPYCQNNSGLRPQDLFSWSSAGTRSNQTTGLRYFSINGGNTRIVDFNQQSNGDRGDWISPTCPQPHPYVQNAFLCQGQYSDVTTTSPEGINLDVIGFDLQTAAPPLARYDFNGDGKADYVIYNAATRQTVIWYMNNNAFVQAVFGPTLAAGFKLVAVADFNRDHKQDYLLYNASTRQSAIWYLNNNVVTSGRYGPTLPTGWQLVAAGDFNRDGKPDYVIYNPATRQTGIWYMNDNVFVQGVLGPTLASGFKLSDVADFNRDGKPDYLLFNASTHKSAIWYLSGARFVSGAYGPTVATGFAVSGSADFNRDSKADYLLYKASAGQTAIWYLNNNALISGAYGPTLPSGWTLVAP